MSQNSSDTPTDGAPAAPDSLAARATPRPDRIPTFRSWGHRGISALKRSHWLFRLGEFVRLRLEMQDEQILKFNDLANAVQLMATHESRLAEFVNDLRQRLAFHENQGPLQASKRELDRRRADGMIRPLDAKRNGGRRSQPAQTIDASGRVKPLAVDTHPCPKCGEPCNCESFVLTAGHATQACSHFCRSLSTPAIDKA